MLIKTGKHVIRLGAQAKQIPVPFVCVYASSTHRFIAVSIGWITVFARFDHYFNRIQNAGALELNHFVIEHIHLMPFLASVSRPQGVFDY